jgi:hypothetical protein
MGSKMRILTEENKSLSMNDVPDEVDDLRYCVLDYTDHANIDYIFIPLIFLETFNKPCVDLRVGKYRIQLPSDWSIVIGDKNSGEVEILNLKQLNDRPFDAFVLNPLSGYIPEFLDIEIMNIFPDMKWYFPKLKYGHLLAVPLDIKDKSNCIFVVKDTNKIPDILDITQMV